MCVNACDGTMCMQVYVCMCVCVLSVFSFNQFQNFRKFAPVFLFFVSSNQEKIKRSSLSPLKSEINRKYSESISRICSQITFSLFLLSHSLFNASEYIYQMKNKSFINALTELSIILLSEKDILPPPSHQI